MVLKEDGSVWATGYNNYGQLGDGSKTYRTVFVQVVSDGAEALAAGAYHSVVFARGGSVWAAGSNRYGQLGDNSITYEKTFVRLAPFGNGKGHDTITCSRSCTLV